MLKDTDNHFICNSQQISLKSDTRITTQRSPEQITEQLIFELRDQTLFVRSCVLKGTKYILQCKKNFEIAINHVNELLKKKLIELGQVKTIYCLYHEFQELGKSSESLKELISVYSNSFELKSTLIIQQYESIKESILVSKRIIQIQDLCNRTIDFISLFNRLKIQFGIVKSIGYEDQYAELLMKLQNDIPETINISKTSKMIVELESMVNPYNKNSNEIYNLEFVEELQEEIIFLRKLSAIYRQHGHKKLVNGIENVDRASISYGCLILYQFNELWEHLDTFVDVTLKKIQYSLNVNNLQNCIEINEKPKGRFTIKTEFVTISILSIIEKTLNQIIISLKQLVCLFNTIVEEKLTADRSFEETNFIQLFWERSLKIIESVFNNISSASIKNTLIDEIIIVGGSIKLEQIFLILSNSYPEILNMFGFFMRNVNTLLSSSPSKTTLTKIIENINIYDTAYRIREKYFELIKIKFNTLFDFLLPKNKYEKKNGEIPENISQLVSTFIKEIKMVNNSEFRRQICDLFKNKLLCFIVSCETIIQPEGGIIPCFEHKNINSYENKYPENINLNCLPSNSHKINAEISCIAGLFSIELEKIFNHEVLNDWDEVEKYRIIELLKSLQYKSVGKWFSHTSLSIINIFNNPEINSNQEYKDIENIFTLLSQKIINYFVQVWLPILHPIQIWFKCLVLLSRNISIIFLVNFVLRIELDEESCFSIADDIVAFQSIISHFFLDQKIKNNLESDIKMIQNFRRILFSDLNSIKEAIEAINDNKIELSINTEILMTSVKEMNSLLFSIHILNRIYFILKNKIRDICSFNELYKIKYFQLYNTIASIIFKKLNCDLTCDSDSDLFVIFNIFKQNAHVELNNPKEIFSLISKYIEYLKSEISKCELDSDQLNYSNLFTVLDFIVKNINIS